MLAILQWAAEFALVSYATKMAIRKESVSTLAGGALPVVGEDPMEALCFPSHESWTASRPELVLFGGVWAVCCLLLSWSPQSGRSDLG
ncbi:hypothetical protein GCM10008949_16930 [Deinococcus humi]|nr:hypothetical protein GCM10008949_16930 [Deinococcus humi]